MINNINVNKDILCTRIVGYVYEANLAFWKIVLLNGQVIYKSDIHYKDDTWVMDLSTLNLPIGTQLKLEVELSGYNYSSSEILTYTPDSNATVYYESLSYLDYIGVVPLFYESNAEPCLNCTGVSFKNTALTSSKFILFSLDGATLYETPTLDTGEHFSMDLKATNTAENSVFKIKAILSSGEIIIADVTIKFTFDSIYWGAFELSGLTARNELMYKGTYSLITDLTIVPSDQIIAYNNSNMVVKYSIALLDGTQIYTSDNKLEWDTAYINLNTLTINNLKLRPGIQVRVKAIIPAKDIINDFAIEYRPGAGTSYYEFSGKAAVPSSHTLYYYDVLPSVTTPPLLKCSSIRASNNSRMITKFALIDDGLTLYLSNRCRIDKTWNLNLDDLSLIPGTQFILKANAIGGDDSTAYVTLEYDPLSNAIGNFQFCGNAFKTVLIYKGQLQLV